MKYVLTYHAVDDFLPLARENYPAHAVRLREFHDRATCSWSGRSTSR